jgi:hypothetical protein
MDNGAVADTLMSALTRVQTALAPPPDTAGDAEYAAQVEDDLNMEEWHSTCDAALAAFLAQCDPTEGDAALAASLAPPDTTGDAAFAASLAPQVSSLVDPRALRPRYDHDHDLTAVHDHVHEARSPQCTFGADSSGLQRRRRWWLVG